MAAHRRLPGRVVRTLLGRSPVTWALALVLVAGVIALAVVDVRRWQARGDRAAGLGDAPVEVANAAARDFFSLDHRHIDRDITRVQDAATGSFAAQYRKQAAALRKSVLAKELVLTATVADDGTAVEYVAPDEAWVLVPVDVHTTAGGRATVDTRYRTRVVLEKVDGQWRVSRLERVG